MINALITACGGALVSGLVVLLQQALSRRAERKKNQDVVMARLSEIEHKLDDHIERYGRDKADVSRLRILRFTDEVKNNVRHTEEHWNEILSEIDRYEAFSVSHPEYPNNKAVRSIELLKAIYEELLEKNDFI